MAIPKISNRDRKLILEALKTLHINDYKACADAVSWLLGGSVWAAPTVRVYREWLYWLGVALCQANVLQWPKYAEEDIDAETCPLALDCVECTFIRPRDAEWYWDYKTVLWGVREYVRRKRRKAQQ